MVTWRHTSLYLFYNKRCLLDFHNMTLRTPCYIIRTLSIPPSVSVWRGWVGEIPTTLPPLPPTKKSPVWIFGNSTCLMRNGTFRLPNAIQTTTRLVIVLEGTIQGQQFVRWKGTFQYERPDWAKGTTLKGGPKSLSGQSSRCFVQGRVVQSWVKITQG